MALRGVSTETLCFQGPYDCESVSSSREDRVRRNIVPMMNDAEPSATMMIDWRWLPRDPRNGSSKTVAHAAKHSVMSLVLNCVGE
jgi:hypothetical protein